MTFYFEKCIRKQFVLYKWTWHGSLWSITTLSCRFVRGTESVAFVFDEGKKKKKIRINNIEMSETSRLHSGNTYFLSRLSIKTLTNPTCPSRSVNVSPSVNTGNSSFKIVLLICACGKWWTCGLNIMRISVCRVTSWCSGLHCLQTVCMSEPDSSTRLQRMAMIWWIICYRFVLFGQCSPSPVTLTDLLPSQMLPPPLPGHRPRTSAGTVIKYEP